MVPGARLRFKPGTETQNLAVFFAGAESYGYGFQALPVPASTLFRIKERMGEAEGIVLASATMISGGVERSGHYIPAILLTVSRGCYLQSRICYFCLNLGFQARRIEKL